MAKAAERAVNDPAEVVAEAGVRFLAPVPDPPSIRDFYAGTSRRHQQHHPAVWRSDTAAPLTILAA